MSLGNRYFYRLLGHFIRALIGLNSKESHALFHVLRDRVIHIPVGIDGARGVIRTGDAAHFSRV